ncbi:MAG: hypothetical protein QOI59_4921, partial [Gammaproteobacteria bacterium]|nr:hypothetical protein [Gammaproteobacteria bacterium]
LNLIVNAIQSMSGVEDGNRELHISTVSIEPEGVCVAVRDTSRAALADLVRVITTSTPQSIASPCETPQHQSPGLGRLVLAL